MPTIDTNPVCLSNPATWIASHGDVLFAYCLARVRDRATAEDLVQETFLAALQAAGGFRGDAAERTWLIGILRHKVIDHHRRRARERGAGDGDATDAVVDGWFDGTDHWRQAPSRWQPDASTLADDREFWTIAHACLAAMPTRLASAFTLRLMEDLPAEEVCKELEISPTNLWVMLHRARARLRDCLERHWFARDAR